MRYKRINISVSKEELIKILQKILKTETNLDFLLDFPDGHPKSPTYGHLKIPHPQGTSEA